MDRLDRCTKDEKNHLGVEMTQKSLVDKVTRLRVRFPMKKNFFL